MDPQAPLPTEPAAPLLPPPPAPAGSPAEGSNAKIIYILYLVSLLTGVTGIVGVIMAYVYRAQAPAWVQSHYRFQIRTFWISLLLGFVAALTFVLVIGVVLAVFLLVWMIVRCVKGLQLLEKGLPYPKEATWIW